MIPIKNNYKAYADGNFQIIIVETKNEYEYWLKHLNYGTAEMEYGVLKKDHSIEEFMEIVKKTLEEDEDYYLYNRYQEELMWNEIFEKERRKSHELQNAD